jgi:hypothetical protein
MRIIVLVLTVTLAACASEPSLEELEDQAMVSGDWSAVERREEIQRDLRGKSAQSCPDKHTMVCEQTGANDKCTCIPPRW